MNTLNSLLNDALTSTDHVQQCAIIRRKDGSLRSCSAGFPNAPNEIQKLVNSFRDPQDIRENGIEFAGRKYKVVRADNAAVYAKEGKNGVIIVRTPTLIVVGMYDANMFPGVCAEAIEKLADYFREKGR